MRSFLQQDRYSSDLNLFGDKEGHTMVQVTAPDTRFHMRYEQGENGELLETHIGKASRDSGRLFLSSHEPPKVNYLGSTAPHQVPAAVAAAALHSKDRWGEYPKPSDNLSSYSLPLVQHFADLGVVKKEDVPTRVGNDLNPETAKRREWDARYALRQNDRMTTSSHPVLGTEDKDNVLYARGRTLIRSTLRARRSSSRKGNPQQFTNVPLPGMEGM